MTGVQYQHIGHDPRQGEIALWSVDDRGVLHEARRRFAEANGEWLDWSHENQFTEVKVRALGRVEVERKTGSIHLSDGDWSVSESRLCRLLDVLDRAYPSTRWYVFGNGFSGESIGDFLCKRFGLAA
jgi:hypothetical protein